MRSNSYNKRKKKNKFINNADMPVWQKLKNYSQIRTDSSNNMIEDNFNIENPTNRSVPLKKK